MFVGGIVLGFAAAVAMLPLPGKTFFNRMSKLPPKARDLIDNTIDVGISFFCFTSSLVKEVSYKANKALNKGKIKLEEIKQNYEIQKSLTGLDESIDLQNADEDKEKEVKV
jgi:hypothetical protein